MTHHVLDMPITDAQARTLKVGDTVTLEKTLFGIRDATLIAMFDRGRTTRFDLRGHAVIHTAPNVRKVDPRPANSSGYEPLCIGTTTSMRMERFTRPLMEREGVKLIIGKGGMGQSTLDAFRDLGGAYLAVVGGAAALETTWIERSKRSTWMTCTPRACGSSVSRASDRCPAARHAPLGTEHLRRLGARRTWLTR